MGTAASNQVGSRSPGGSSEGRISSAKSSNSTFKQHEPIFEKERQKTSVTKFEAEKSTSSSTKENNERAPASASAVDLHERVRQLENELTKSESQRLDLQDQLQLFEEQLKQQTAKNKISTSTSPESLSETIHAKDQYIMKLEKDLKNVELEAKNARLKLRKRIRVLTNQLYEVKQEASISQMELKADMAKQVDTLKKSQSPTYASEGSSSQEPQDSHSKLILELSSQALEQSEQISTLQDELHSKDVRIQELEAAITRMNTSSHQDSTHGKSSRQNKTVTYDENNLASTSTDRLQSSRGRRVYGKDGKVSNYTRDSLNSQGLSLSRQSTALSDSDSDWEVDSIPSHTHSAPARMRVKSAMSHSSSAGKKRTEHCLSATGDDDSVIHMDQFSPSPNPREQNQKRSSLKNRQQQVKAEKQAHALIGPSIAFANTPEAFSDTSCEPTPRNQQMPRLPGFTKLKVIDPVAQ